MGRTFSGKMLASKKTVTPVATKGEPIKKPKRKKSAFVRARQFEKKVLDLSASELKELTQFQPFKRMVVRALCHGVERVKTESVFLLMEAALQYSHRLYTDSYEVTCVAARRKTLMFRDLMAAVTAKGDAIVNAPEDVDDDDLEEDENGKLLPRRAKAAANEALGA